MNYADTLDIKTTLINALKEDIGTTDITTESIIPKNKFVKAFFLAKEDCVVCGLGVVSQAFKIQDKTIKFVPLVKEGDFVKKGSVIARISGKARGILTTERVALNFLSLLCGIATTTRKFVDAVEPYKVNILDTRKTLPGLRLLEKYAVRVGGGSNHRMRLDEMLLIKDNHLAALCVPFREASLRSVPVRRASCVKKIIEAVKKKKAKDMKLEIEVKNLKEFKEALKVRPDIIMLDNMKVEDIKKAVIIRRKAQSAKRKTLIEASGRISLKNAKVIASAGVDAISSGALTHSVDSVDISLEII